MATIIADITKNGKFLSEELHVEAYFNGWHFPCPMETPPSWKRPAMSCGDDYTEEARQFVKKVNTKLNRWKAQGKMPSTFDEQRPMTEEQQKQLAGDDDNHTFLTRWFFAINHLELKRIIPNDDNNGLLILRTKRYNYKGQNYCLHFHE
jgi:hypothetical protein